MGFTSPDEKTIRDAIGDVTQLPVQLQRAIASDHDAFEPIPKPRPAIGWLCIKSKIRRLNNSRHRVQIALLQTETSFIFNRSVISPLNEARRSKNSVSLPLPSLPWRSKLYRPFRSRISRPGAIRSPITRKSLPLTSFAFLKRASPPMPSAFWLLPWKILSRTFLELRVWSGVNTRSCWCL